MNGSRTNCVAQSVAQSCVVWGGRAGEMATATRVVDAS